MQILNSILRLLRRPGVATSPVPMHRLSCTSRPLVSFMASARPHSALARRVFQLIVAPNPALHCVSRFPHASRNMASTSGGVNGYKSGKPDRRSRMSSTNNHSAISECMKKIEARGTTLEVRRSTIKDRKRAVVVSDEEDVNSLEILPKSTHRDGSLYNVGTHIWKRHYHVMDRSETWLEAMMLSNPTDCVIDNGICTEHTPRPMLQFFSIKLAELFVARGPVKLYGYIAVRDGLDPSLNYVVNLSRDDPIIVEKVNSHTYLQLFQGLSLATNPVIEVIYLALSRKPLILLLKVFYTIQITTWAKPTQGMI